MSDPLASAAQDWFKKGTDAMNRQNWDFAVECFSSCVKMKPDAVLYRQTKHGCSRKVYDDNGTGAKMAGMKLMTLKGRIKKARSKKDWAGMAQLAEDGLIVNPWDANLFADLGQAAAELDRGEIAAYAYTKAVEIDRLNIDFNRRLGQVLHERGEYKKARECFKRIYEADPTDGDARSMMSRIDADAVMDRGGYEKAQNTQDVKADKTPTNAYEEDRRARGGGKGPAEAAAPGESEEMDLRAAIRKDPANVSYYLKLADLLRRNRQLPQAIEQLDKALEIAGSDISVLEQKEDVELEIMREKSAEANDRARKNPERERLKVKADTLKKELVVREIEVFAARVDNHKSDMKMRFELAERYRSTKQHKLAISLYQQATADSRLKEEALAALGECFLRTGKIDLGRRQFDKALETLNHKDRPEAFLNAHYYLGRLYEKAGKNEQAEHHYNEILSADYDFRDVLKRLEELQGGDEFADFDDDD